MKSYLGLATGEIFPGISYSGRDETTGEVVLFHSRNFPHQILTDPANYNRIIVSDSTIVENRGPLFAELESHSPHIEALVLLGSLEKSPLEEHYPSLENYLAEYGVGLFKPRDPVRLKQALLRSGPVRGMITSGLEKLGRFRQKFVADHLSMESTDRLPNIDGDPISKLSTALDFYWDINDETTIDSAAKEYVVVAYDFGLANSSLRNLKRLGCDIRVVPADYSPEQVIALKPEGILLAGGPGQPTKMDYAISNISRLIGLRPILATGLGHILLALTVGAKIEILKAPHFGDEIEICPTRGYRIHNSGNRIKTLQAHSISIDRRSLEKEGFRVTLTNPDDESVEGFENEDYLLQSYAFSLGGQDEFTLACLRKFIRCMADHRAIAKLQQPRNLP